MALRFDIVDFVGYDVFVLKRAKAANDYDPTLVAAAQQRILAKTEDEIARLERNVIAGLPGGAEAQTRESIARSIASFEGLGDDQMRDNLAAFLREVVPVAEEVGVRLAIHPDDPPRSLFGLPRVVSTAADARLILRAVDREANGLTLCAGSYGSRADNDVVAMAREFAPRIHFAHLRNVTLEPDGSFHEAEHLDGGVDMVSLVEVLLREERAARAEGPTLQHPHAAGSRAPARGRHREAHEPRLFLHRPVEGPGGIARRHARAERTPVRLKKIVIASAAKQPRGRITRPLGSLPSQ